MIDISIGTVWAFEQALGDYAGDIVDLLLADGYPVALTTVQGPRAGGGDHEDLLEKDDVDGRVVVTFPAGTAPRFTGMGPYDSVTLSWGGLSGWRITAGGLFGGADRWMGAGLFPSPSAVANFVATAAIDLDEAGSEDRPFYRAAGHDLDTLLHRLMSANVSNPNETRSENTDQRVRQARLATCWRGITSALESGQADPAIVTITTDELRALDYLVEFAIDVEGENHHVRRFAHLLIQDIQTRAGLRAGQTQDTDTEQARTYVQQNSF
ncbi:hypothetical protein ACFY00_30510 [Kitasatospora sp. NPDC001540]|uniref:hypothetical protein n=1 Tax=Kitasatospora sp. NPDC001540 TaxID=3364014 RepID=UPI003677D882